MHYLPIEIETALKQHFNFPEKLLYGSVATLQDKHPNIRTMRIYEINPEGCPVLLTHVASNKWREFLANPYAAINMLSENKITQIIVQGKLQLDTPKSAYDKTHAYWHRVRPDVKKIYDPAHAVGAPFKQVNFLQILEAVPDTFGIACMIPEFWELLYLDSEYTNSHREQFRLQDGQWQKLRVNVG